MREYTPILSRIEAAEYLGVKVSYLADLTDPSDPNFIPFIKISRKLVRYKKKDLDKWLAERIVAKVEAVIEVEAEGTAAHNEQAFVIRKKETPDGR